MLRGSLERRENLDSNMLGSSEQRSTSEAHRARKNAEGDQENLLCFTYKQSEYVRLGLCIVQGVWLNERDDSLSSSCRASKRDKQNQRRNTHSRDTAVTALLEEIREASSGRLNERSAFQHRSDEVHLRIAAWRG